MGLQQMAPPRVGTGSAGMGKMSIMGQTFDLTVTGKGLSPARLFNFSAKNGKVSALKEAESKRLGFEKYV